MSGVLEGDFVQSLREFQLAEQARRSATGCLQAFETALVSRDAARIGALFHEDSHWRDVLAFTWTITTHSGREAIEQALRPTLVQTRATGDWGADVVGRDGDEVEVRFERQDERWKLEADLDDGRLEVETSRKTTVPVRQ